MNLRSSPWFMMSGIVTFFLCFQLVQIFVVVTAKCYQPYEFWLDSRSFGFNPFTLSAVAFLLFGILALTELVFEYRSSMPGSWSNIGIYTLVIVCSIGSLVALKTQYESFEVLWKERSAKDFSIRVLEIPDTKWIDSFRLFIRQKECTEPGFDYNDVDSWEKYEKLQQEFLDGGGELGYKKVPID